jgi:release factor glutamine methyltransferase
MPGEKLLDLINSATARLERKGAVSARVNVERMLCAALECQRVDLYVDPDRIFASEIISRFEEMLSRRLADEPLQYILGETEFYGLRIKCDRRALIPRPETEFVVSKAIDCLERFDRLYILDLACGTGCIGIALAMNLPQASITAADISEDAISLAKENAMMHNLITRFRFSAGDMFSAAKGQGILYDAVVCNPPYIRDGEWEMLQSQIRDFEPKRALLSGEDGLDFIRLMLRQVSEYLVSGGYLIFEIGMGQAELVRQLITETGTLQFIETVQDYAAIERVVVARRTI